MRVVRVERSYEATWTYRIDSTGGKRPYHPAVRDQKKLLTTTYHAGALLNVLHNLHELVSEFDDSVVELFVRFYVVFKPKDVLEGIHRAIGTSFINELD